MAGKKKKDDKGTTGSGSFLPKSIAGVKLPKAVRGKLSDLAKHPVVADILAAGLVAIAARLKNEPKVRKGAADAADAGKDVAETVAQAVADVATTIAKPVAKRARKTPAAAPKSSAETPAKPVARRTRKAAAASPAPASAPPARKAPAAAAETGAKPVARRSRKASESSTAKPRAGRRAAPKKPSPPKTPE